MGIGISIIICCYNSSTRLPETLQHIALQQVIDNISWEVIVVNNNSNDTTVEVAKKEWLKYNCKAAFKVINEPNPGLSHARKAGIFAAQYTYSIFCDDDNWLDQKYIQTAFNNLNCDDSIAAVGGYGTAISSMDFPTWFVQYADGYAVGNRGLSSGYMPNGQLLIGAGICFRKNLYLKAYSQLPSLLNDRKGSELSSGGDFEMCLRFLLMKYKLYFDENLVFKHFIPPERLTVEYRDELYQGFRLSSPCIEFYHLLVRINSYSLFKRYMEVLKSAIRIPFSYLRLITHWDHNQNLHYFYLLTGWQLININPTCSQIRNELRFLYK